MGSKDEIDRANDQKMLEETRKLTLGEIADLANADEIHILLWQVLPSDVLADLANRFAEDNELAGAI